MSFGIKVTEEDDLKARGLANNATDLDMIISPRDGSLVPVAVHHGAHVCWGCFELFDESDPKLRMVEIRPNNQGTVRVGVHAKCVDPKNRKPFVDMKGSRELQSVEEVSKGIKLRRMVAKVVKPFVDAATATTSKIIP